MASISAILNFIGKTKTEIYEPSRYITYVRRWERSKVCTKKKVFWSQTVVPQQNGRWFCHLESVLNEIWHDDRHCNGRPKSEIWEVYVWRLIFYELFCIFRETKWPPDPPFWIWFWQKTIDFPTKISHVYFKNFVEIGR